MSERKNRAAVCYCLCAEEMSSVNMTQVLGWCQDTFERASFRELYQGFAVGRNIQFAVPMRMYPSGFRGVLDESDRKSVLMENLVLGYSVLHSFMKKNVGREDIAYYLVLLVADDTLRGDEDLQAILKKYSDLKNKYGLQICCIGTSENVTYDRAFNLIDATGESGIKMLLSDRG